MYKKSMEFKPFESKVLLDSQTMHEEDIEFAKEAYDTTGCQQ